MTDSPSPDTVRAVQAAAVSVPRPRLDSLDASAERAEGACADRDLELARAEIASMRRALASLTRDHAEIRDEWDERSSQFAAPQRLVVEVKSAKSDPPPTSRRDSLRAMLGTRRGKVIGTIGGLLATLGITEYERLARALWAFGVELLR